MIIIDDYDQRSPEWFEARLGNPGASSFDKIVTNVKGTKSASAKEYMFKLAAQIVSGIREESYTNKWMERGTELEQDAIDYFSFYVSEVRQVALCYADEQKKYHISPDGLCEDGGGLEVKCPKPQTHVKYLIENEFPKKEYNAQVQGSLMVSGLSHWWFMSYCPGIKPFIVKVLPDLEYHEKLKTALDTFCADLAQMIGRLK